MKRCILCLTVLFLILSGACSKPAAENPFDYPFIRPLHLKREASKPYSDYKAFYLLTEDFEPLVDTSEEMNSASDLLKFASSLSSTYKVPWTHFVDVNTLAAASTSSDQNLKQRSQKLIDALKQMVEDGDDCELHLHGPLNRALLDQLRSQEKQHLRGSAEAVETYRQRRSFFYQSFYHEGYRELVASLTYGRRFLEDLLYGGTKQVLAFRPGGWDHGSTSADTLLYFKALSDSGLIANSGLSSGDFGGKNWRVGNDPGRNIATLAVGDKSLFEVSPTAGPGGYVNPVLPNDLSKLAASVSSEMAVIVSVYHLGALQPADRSSSKAGRPESEIQTEREALEQHFKTVANLAEQKILYPITLRDLLAIISAQQ